jgi:hypothetical protein
MDKIESINNEFNYFTYNMNLLMDLHNELQSNFKLNSFMNNSKCEEFIQIILNNLIFKNDDDFSDDDFSDDTDIINLNDT